MRLEVVLLTRRPNLHRRFVCGVCLGIQLYVRLGVLEVPGFSVYIV